MAISNEQKSYINQYIREIEKEKEEKLDKRISHWITIFSILGVASLSGTILIIYNNVRDTAVAEAVQQAEDAVKNKIDERLSLDRLLEMQVKAIESSADARSKIFGAEIISQENATRAGYLLNQSRNILDEIVKIKTDLAAAQETIAAFRSINTASGELAANLANQPGFKDDIAKKINLPPGMVVAFNTTEIRGVCPIGWRTFEPADGRFIVGASKNPSTDDNGNPLTSRPSYADDPVKAVGGEENHIQTLEELVPHRHDGATKFANVAEKLRVVFQAGETVYGNQVVGFRSGSNYRDETNVAIPGAEHTHNFETDTGRGALGKPQNNMPPFIALYYCIKE